MKATVLQHEAPKAAVSASPGKATNNPLQLKKDAKAMPSQTVINPLAAVTYNQNPLQLKGKKTGLPDNLKAGVETLSGYSMDDVKVHYNSGRPEQLQALAYAQGTDIHVAPGQEKHLPHEAWHVVQQQQGRVKKNLQMKGQLPINDNSALESEADIMGKKAAENSSQPVQLQKNKKEGKLASKRDKQAREGAREARYASTTGGGTTVFNNDEGRLPTAPKGQHYTESDVGKGRNNRGKRRVVSLVDSNTGRVYKQYNTENHYDSFA